MATRHLFSHPDQFKRCAGIGLLSLRLSVSRDAPVGDFLFAPACPIGKITLWEGLLYLTAEFETYGVSELQTGTPRRTPACHPLIRRFRRTYVIPKSEGALAV